VIAPHPYVIGAEAVRDLAGFPIALAGKLVILHEFPSAW
jgi:hypothetical protein